MLYFIRHQGKEYRIRVESRNKKLYVTFGDEPEQDVDLLYHGNNCNFIQDHEVFHANVVGKKTDYTVWLPTGNMTFSLESEYRRIVNMLRGQELDHEHNVYAKMPGKIVKILVKAGDELTHGASVIVMEAMKMENEIRVPSQGRVKNVCVKEGQAVETGTLLVEMDPETDA